MRKSPWESHTATAALAAANSQQLGGRISLVQCSDLAGNTCSPKSVAPSDNLEISLSDVYSVSAGRVNRPDDEVA